MELTNNLKINICLLIPKSVENEKLMNYWQCFVTKLVVLQLNKQFLHIPCIGFYVLLIPLLCNGLIGLIIRLSTDECINSIKIINYFIKLNLDFSKVLKNFFLLVHLIFSTKFQITTA